jgi:hypothetical protein
MLDVGGRRPFRASCFCCSHRVSFREHAIKPPAIIHRARAASPADAVAG